jgi:L-fuconolactonase
MAVVDTHCHASLSWFEPVETLLFQMDTYGVDKAVLVQHGGEYDNSYLLACAEEHLGRFAVMGMVDSTLPDAPETLAAWHARGVGSVRLFGPPGAAFVADRSDPVVVWRKAAELGMPVSTPSNALEISAPSFQSLIEELPDLHLIFEHYGFLRLREDQQEEAYEKLLELARFPNVTMKIHGLGELIPRPFPLRNPTFDVAQAPDHIDRAMQAFGAHRLMLASDWPLSAGREGYSNVFSYLKAYLSRYSTDQQAAVLGSTAERIFAL